MPHIYFQKYWYSKCSEACRFLYVAGDSLSNEIHGKREGERQQAPQKPQIEIQPGQSNILQGEEPNLELTNDVTREQVKGAIATFLLHELLKKESNKPNIFKGDIHKTTLYYSFISGCVQKNILNKTKHYKTRQSIDLTLGHLKEFLKSTQGKDDIPFNALDLAFLHTFQVYAATQWHCRKNAILMVRAGKADQRLFIVSDPDKLSDILHQYLSSPGLDNTVLFELRKDPHHVLPHRPNQISQVLPRKIDHHGHTRLKIRFVFFPQHDQLQGQPLPNRSLSEQCQPVCKDCELVAECF